MTTTKAAFYFAPSLEMSVSISVVTYSGVGGRQTHALVKIRESSHLSTSALDRSVLGFADRHLFFRSALSGTELVSRASTAIEHKD